MGAQSSAWAGQVWTQSSLAVRCSVPLSLPTPIRALFEATSASTSAGTSAMGPMLSSLLRPRSPCGSQGVNEWTSCEAAWLYEDAAPAAPAAPAADDKKVVDWNADKIARKCAAIEVDPDLDIAALRAKAQGNKMTDEEKKERGLLYDTSKAAAVREESEDEDDEGACDMGGDPFEGL